MANTSFKCIYKGVKSKKIVAIYRGSMYLWNNKGRFYKLIPKEKEATIVNRLIDIEIRDKVPPWHHWHGNKKAIHGWNFRIRFQKSKSKVFSKY